MVREDSDVGAFEEDGQLLENLEYILALWSLEGEIQVASARAGSTTSLPPSPLAAA